MLTTRRVEEIFINKDNKCWYLDVKIFFDGSAYSLDDDYSIIIFLKYFYLLRFKFYSFTKFDRPLFRDFHFCTREYLEKL